jgi:dTDP-4-dehydrorhamnose 3,5-epimerase
MSSATQQTKLSVEATAIDSLLIIEPKVFGDERGWFTESFNAQDFALATGLDIEFVQDNHSYSRKDTLRGLHYQLEKTQGKLVRVTSGAVFDVAVDLRQKSPSYGKMGGCRSSVPITISNCGFRPDWHMDF